MNDSPRRSPRLFRRLAAVLALLVFLPAAAAPKLEPGGSGIVREIVDGDTLVIEMAGTTPATTPEAARGAKIGAKIELRLVGIQAPKLPLGRPGFQPWPLGDESKSALARLALGKTLTLAFGGQRLDRHGRLLAHLFAADGSWIQGEMLRQGQARVYTFADNRGLANEMYALERAAREAKRGIWADPFYAVRAPEDLEALEGTFQIVEGTVTKAARVRGRGYLNFGEDWKTDFTVTIPSAGLALFRRAKLDIAAYGGKRVRVRGWVGSYRGATIEATHPEQIEVLDP